MLSNRPFFTVILLAEFQSLRAIISIGSIRWTAPDRVAKL